MSNWKKEIETILQSVEIQHVLARMTLHCFDNLNEEAAICQTIAATEKNGISADLLRDIFTSVNEIGEGAETVYAVSQPKRNYLQAMEYCRKQGLLNPYIAYFNRDTVKNDIDAKADGPVHERLLIDPGDGTRPCDPAWRDFVESLKDTADKLGTSVLLVCGFTVEELKEDTYVKALAAEFPQIMLTADYIPAAGTIKALELRTTVGEETGEDVPEILIGELKLE